MLHILWLILKFILIILGILLGLLLLAVLLILFCPVRYKASAVKTEGDWKQTEGEGAVSWLFHGVSLKAEWRDQQMKVSFHLFGIPLDKLLKKPQKEETAPEKSRKKSPETGSERTETVTDVPVVQDKSSTKQFEPEKQISASAENKTSEAALEPESTDTDINTEPEKTDSVQQTQNAPEDTLKKRQFFIKKIYDRIRGGFQAISAKLRNIRSTLQRIKRNVSWWKSFIQHPRVTAAGKLVWKHAKFLLKHIFPTKIEGQVTFSFEDPALTGTALAVLGMTIPFHKNCVQINPCFDGQNYLYGNIRAKGRVYGVAFVRAAVMIYFNKNIKYVIKRWKTRRA